MTSARKWRIDLGSLALLLVPLLAVFPLRNNDLWWHLAAGRWMVENLRFPSADVFSHTAFMEPWVDNEWLAQLLFYGSWKIGGNAGLLVLRVVLLATVFLLVRAYLLCARRTAATFPAIVIGVALSYSWWELRPSLFSLIGMLVLLCVLEGIRRDRLPCWLLPCIFLPWANLHPGFFLGLLVLAGTVAALFVERRLPRERRFSSDERLPSRLLAWTGVSLAATLVNPYGFLVFRQQLAIARNFRYRELLDEWAPPSAAFLALVLVTVAVFLVLRFRKVPLPALVPILGTALLATTGVRFVEYFGVVAIPGMLACLGRPRPAWIRTLFLGGLVVGSLLIGLLPPMGSALREGGQVIGQLDAADLAVQARGWRNVTLLAVLLAASLAWAWMRRRSAFVPTLRRLWRGGSAAIPCTAVGIVLAVVLLVARPLPNDGVEADRYPVACLDALPEGSRPFNKLSWGGWLIWKKGIQTYIDGRCWGQPIFFEYRDARQASGEEILLRRGIDAVILPPSDAILDSLAVSPRWEKTCSDAVSVVYRTRARRPRT